MSLLQLLEFVVNLVLPQVRRHLTEVRMSSSEPTVPLTAAGPDETGHSDLLN
jgi:hypothetical protein